MNRTFNNTINRSGFETVCLVLYSGAAGQSFRLRKVGCLNPDCNRTKSLKQAVKARMHLSSATGVSAMGPRK